MSKRAIILTADWRFRHGGATWIVLLLVCLIGVTGCETPTPNYPNIDEQLAVKPEVIVLREGDSVRISFPGAPDLNTVQPIRRDGRITLQMAGDFMAAGMTPPQLEQELIKLYGPKLQMKEVTVAVESSTYPVYLSGAVMRPGKIVCDRPMTALEAVMEAGFDNAKANLKAVRVIRYENGHVTHQTLNLQRTLEGKDTEPFKLKPSDMIYVPEKFSWL